MLPAGPGLSMTISRFCSDIAVRRRKMA